MKYFFSIICLLFSAGVYSQFVATTGYSGIGGSTSSPLLDSLFAYYPLDESSGNFEDVHGGRDLTASGTLTYSVSGRVGTCVTFITDGQGKYTADDFEFSGSYTISAWVKTNFSGARQDAVTYYGSPGRGWTLRQENGAASNAPALTERYWNGGSVWSYGTGVAINDD